jgi:hypothetical protein
LMKLHDQEWRDFQPVAESEGDPEKFKESLKHEWVPVNTLLSTETATYPVCKRCGIVMRADEANKDKPCKGPVKITLRNATI